MQLDEEQLARVREALAIVKRCQGRRVPREALARLGDALPAGVG